MAALRRLALIASVAALAAPAANAGLISGIVGVALPTCGAASQPFAQFGDFRSYYSVPNNGLESGSTGWSLSRGAAVVAGNEPWHVSGPGAFSLGLPAGASALTPATCINLLDPAIRFFAASADANGVLHVQVIFRGLLGNTLGILNSADLAPADYMGWSPTEAVSSALALPLGTTSFQLRLTSTASSGTWQVDDVYVDPTLLKG